MYSNPFKMDENKEGSHFNLCSINKHFEGIPSIAKLGHLDSERGY
jgi:hypothetical protein